MNQIDTTEEVSAAPEPKTSLVGFCWLGGTAIAMVGWISALAWVAWHFVDWLFA
ncbi:RNA-binding protein [Bradyrhizobium sp.]|uniref:RNA-binding protein n=1 Tax=Bradyrhizobium sp. TaxID=376 RepID=UPI0039E2F409